MAGCVMAIDGVVVFTRAPYCHEVQNVRAYRTRKGGFGVVVQAGCDVEGRFLFISANHAGSTNDSLAFDSTALKDAIDSGRLPPEFFIIGDEAYSCTDQVLSPYPGRGLGRWKDSFNFWLSHSRQCIERAFGMLTQRFGIFWRKFQFSFDRWSLVIVVTAKLHNFCLYRKCKVPLRRYEPDVMPGDSFAVVDNSDNATDNDMRSRARGNRRQNITEDLQREGRGRPMYASCNTRA